MLGPASLPPAHGEPVPPELGAPRLAARPIDRLDSLPPARGGVDAHGEAAVRGSLPPVLGGDVGVELELPIPSAPSSARPFAAESSAIAPHASAAPVELDASRAAQPVEHAAPPAPRDELGLTPEHSPLEPAVDVVPRRSGTMPLPQTVRRAPDPLGAPDAPDAAPRRGTARRAVNLTVAGCLLVVADLVLRNLGIAFPVRPAWVGAALVVLAVLGLAQRALDQG